MIRRIHDGSGFLTPRVAGAPQEKWINPKTESGMIRAAQIAAGVLAFQGALTLLYVLIYASGTDTGVSFINFWSLADVAGCFTLAIWICRASRTAAALAVLYDLSNVCIKAVNHRGGSLMALFALVCFNALVANVRIQRRLRLPVDTVGDEGATQWQLGTETDKENERRNSQNQQENR